MATVVVEYAAQVPVQNRVALLLQHCCITCSQLSNLEDRPVFGLANGPLRRPDLAQIVLFLDAARSIYNNDIGYRRVRAPWNASAQNALAPENAPPPQNVFAQSRCLFLKVCIYIYC